MAKELTKQAIADAFVRLLNQYPLEKITVKNIVETCGVNRNTFYYHYQDIYALLEDIFEREAEKAVAISSNYKNWQEGFVESAHFALENKRAIYHIYNSINRDQLERYLFRVTDHMMAAFVRQQADGLTVAEEDIRYITLFYKHALVGIVLEWVQDGMKLEPEPAITKLGEIFNGNIRSTLERIAK